MLDLLCKSVTETSRLIYRFSIIQLPRTQTGFIQYRRNTHFSTDSTVKKIFSFIFSSRWCHVTPVLQKTVSFSHGRKEVSVKNLHPIYVTYGSVRDETKYMVTYRDQNAGRTHSMKTDNSSFEKVDEFKYLGTTLTNQNSIQEEIKSRLKLGNACYHSVQYLLPSSLLSKN